VEVYHFALYAGGGVDYEDFIMPVQFQSDRECVNITIVNDSLVEDTEQFFFEGTLFPTGANLTFDPSLAVVFIIDHSGASQIISSKFHGVLSVQNPDKFLTSITPQENMLHNLYLVQTLAPGRRRKN
jgi:hypothetical protein